MRSVLLMSFDDFMATEQRRITSFSPDGTIELNSNNDRPLLIDFLAQIISCLGFTLSVVTVWFHWLLPAMKPEAPRFLPRIIPKPRAISPKSRPILLHNSPSVSIQSIMNKPSHNRHVSFSLLMSQPPRSPRSCPSPLPLLPDSLDVELTQLPQTQIFDSQLEYEASPQSSSTSTLTSTPNESLLEPGPSRPSSRLSLSLSARLPRMKKPFGLKQPKSLSDPPPNADGHDPDDNFVIQLNEDPVKGSRKSGALFSNWSLQRSRASQNIVELSEATPSLKSSSSLRMSFGRRRSISRPISSPSSSNSSPASSNVTLPSCFSLKNHRRSSAPIARTQPYGAPYFAPLPVSPEPNVASSYSSYLKRLRQFEDEMDNRPTLEEANEDTALDEFGRGRRASIQVPGHSRQIRRRRSASTSWVTGAALEL